jgi:hypothetical protein
MRDVLSVRQGDISKVYPAMFSEEYPKPLVANFIDVAARDLAEAMAPLPSFNCSATNMVSDAARKAADTRTRIANFYVTNSDLQLQMYTAADWYNTYGLGIGMVEMDYEDNNPRIRMLNPFGTYPELDRYGRVTSVMQVLVTDAETLAAQYPEYYDLILGKNQYALSSPYISMVKYHDKDQDLLYIPERKNLVLSRTPNILGKSMASVVMRSSLDGEARGQFDDVLSVQLARARFAVLQIQAAEKSIQAPIAIPQDVQELALGPDSIMRSANPQGIRRVPLELPPGVFTESGVLERELRLGARYPESRSGNIDASVVTGRGVQALQAGFDTQIKAAQAPALAAQGQDPSEIITRIASVIQGRQKGQSLESTIEKAFTPEPVPTPEMPPMAPGMEQQLPAAGVAPAPASQQPPQEQAGQAPAAGQRPDIAQLLAGITGAA